MREKQPYIGITGISTIEEAEIIAKNFQIQLLGLKTHVAMSGYLVSQKTLLGDVIGPESYPFLGLLPRLLALTAPASTNAIHYSTTDRLTLGDQVNRLLETGNIYSDNLCQTVQLNMLWPDIEQLEKIRVRYPDLGVILQLGPDVLDDPTGVDLEPKLKNYSDVVDYVLLDPSQGQGQPFEVEEIAPFYRTVSHVLRDRPIILAGGFDESTTLKRLRRIAWVLQTSDFGTDAQHGLRINNLETDKIDLGKAISYLHQAAEFFRQSEGEV